MDINSPNEEGLTLFMLAVCNNLTSQVKMYLQFFNPDIEIKDKDGQTALMLACINGYVDIVRLLLSHNANVHATCIKGLTPLTYAIPIQNEDIVKLLLEKGAIVNNQTMGLAQHIGNYQIINLLKENNSNLSNANLDFNPNSRQKKDLLKVLLFHSQSKPVPIFRKWFSLLVRSEIKGLNILCEFIVEDKGLQLSGFMTGLIDIKEKRDRSFVELIKALTPLDNDEFQTKIQYENETSEDLFCLGVMNCTRALLLDTYKYATIDKTRVLQRLNLNEKSLLDKRNYLTKHAKQIIDKSISKGLPNNLRLLSKRIEEKLNPPSRKKWWQ